MKRPDKRLPFMYSHPDDISPADLAAFQKEILECEAERHKQLAAGEGPLAMVVYRWVRNKKTKPIAKLVADKKKVARKKR